MACAIVGAMRSQASAPVDECVVEVDGARFDVRVFRDEAPDAELEPAARRQRSRRERGSLSMARHGAIVAPIPGNVMQVHVADGDTVERGQLLCVLDAMKMENEITAPVAGTVGELSIMGGDLVAGGQQLMRIDE